MLGPEHARTPAWHAVQLLAAHLQATAAPVEPADELVALATRDAGGDAIAVVLIDQRGGGEPRAVEVALPAGAWSGAAFRIVAAALTGRAITLDEVPVAGEGAVVVEAPPASVVVVRVDRR